MSKILCIEQEGKDRLGGYTNMYQNVINYLRIRMNEILNWSE